MRRKQLVNCAGAAAVTATVAAAIAACSLHKPWGNCLTALQVTAQVSKRIRWRQWACSCRTEASREQR